MNVKCATCGQELLGAVNRCWRCGTLVASSSVDGDLPPIRRTPPHPDRQPKTIGPHPPQGARAGGAIAALVLGAMSFLFSYFTPLALVPAIVGLAMGIWGLYSTRRGLAIAGVALCCISLAISGFNALVTLYTLQYGYAPGEAPQELEVYDDAYFDERGDL